MSTIVRPRTLLLPSPLGIPPISDELLESLGERIKPVIERDGRLFYIEPVDPRRTAFTWDPKPTNEAFGLEEVVVLKTLHLYGAPALFKPSIAEVLAQIPTGYTDQIVAFKTAANDSRVNEWPAADSTALNWGYHLATTTLYKPA